ncbi:MAG: hypothetical protein AAB922_03075 [Patescibacteria group bacterium]
MPQITENRIIFDERDFLDGLHPQYTSNAYLKMGEGNTFMDNVNPFRTYGALAPGFNPTDVTQVAQATQIIKNGTAPKHSTNPEYAYLIGYGDETTAARVQRLDILNDTLASAAPWAATGDSEIDNTMDSGHTSHVPEGEDIITYSHNVSSTLTKSVLYSWRDGTDGDVGRHTLNSSTFDSDFMSTVPASGAELGTSPHPMIEGGDKTLYIGDGYVLAAFDGDNGANGTFTANAFSVFDNSRIMSFSKTRRELVIFSYSHAGETGIPAYRGEAFAHFWDYSSTNAHVYDLNDNYVSGGFSWRGRPGCFTYGRGTNFGTIAVAKLKLWNGEEFETLCVFKTNPPGHGGVDVLGDYIQWNSDGEVFTFHVPTRKLYHLSSGSGSTNGGMLKNFTSNKVYVSSGVTTTGGLQTLSINYHSDVTWQSRTVEIPLKGKVEIEAVRVQFAAAATGGRAMSMTLTTDSGGTTTNFLTSVTDVTIASAETSTSKNLVTWINSNSTTVLPVCTDLRLNVLYATGSGATQAPSVSRVDIFYKPYAL